MQYSLLKCGVKISRFGLGCWTIGGPSLTDGYASGWSKVDENDVAKAVNFAVENGVNHFDNADCYGLGESERLLGRCLDARKNDVVISSKVGFLKNDFEHAYVPQNITKQCEKSLQNLGRDYIDIYYFHHGDFGENDKYLDGAIDAMLKLKQAGKIRALGLSCYTTADFVRLVPKIKPDILQGLANILDDKFIKKNSQVRQILDENKIPFVAFSPLAQGLLTGKYDAKNPPKFEAGDHRESTKKFTKENLEKLEVTISKLKKEFGSSKKNMISGCLKYLLDYECVGSVIVGFRSLEQVKENLLAIKEIL